MYFLIAIAPLIFISNIQILQDMLCISVPNGLKLTLNFVAIFLIILVILDWNRKERSKEYKEIEKEFANKKIIKKITKVCDWKKKFPEEGEYVRQYNDPTNYPELRQLHNDRRDIIEHYQNVQQNSDSRLISLEEVKLLIPKNRAKILLNIFEPIEKDIEKITNDDYDPKVFNFIKDLYKKELK